MMCRIRDKFYYLDPGVKIHPTKTFVFVGTLRPRMTGVCGGDPAPQDDKGE